jgi:magnesium-protoporphyrin O-methyltransferase
MNSCCQSSGIACRFGADWATKSLASYRKTGAGDTAHGLVELIKKEDIEGMTVLDIGGGIGAVQYGLLHAGATRAVNVEASAAQVVAAQTEAKRQGLAGRVAVYQGDFVALASTIADEDIVTLDRVVCCYHDMPALVGLSVEHTRKLYGLVYPRKAWWVRAWIVLHNSYLYARRNPFRMFRHSPREIDAIVRRAGFRPRHSARTWFWDIVVYARTQDVTE